MVALGVPAWKPGLFQVGGRWISREQYEAEVNAQAPRRIIENFDQADLAAWRRSSDNPKAGTRWIAIGMRAA